MYEALLAGGSLPVEDTGDVLFLYDPVTATDLSGLGTVTNNTGGAIADAGYLIDGQGSMQYPTVAAKQVMTFAAPLNLSAINWTLEWSSINDTAPTAYALEFSMTSSTAGRGLFFRYGDSGFLDRLHLGDNTASAPADCYNTQFTKAALVSNLSRWAFVCKNGQIFIYRNGQRLPLAKGAANGTYIMQTITPTALINITSLIFGDSNGSSVRAVPGHHGRVRLSNFARYTRNYTPGPLEL
jgi:hypothetical protein